MKNKRFSPFIIQIIILAILVILAMYAFNFIDSSVGSEQLSLMEETIVTYAAQCYALEGFYPYDIDYLENNYSLYVNRDKYVYHYNYIGSNMMPEIKVFYIGTK